MRKPIAVVCLVLLAACADDPEPCTVTQGADGSATITCPDGSTATVEAPPKNACTINEMDGKKVLQCGDDTAVLAENGTCDTLVGDYTIQNSLDVQRFAEYGCTAIDGNLVVNNVGTCEGLASIKTITGSLTINRTKLKSMACFENLTSIPKVLKVQSNMELSECDIEQFHASLQTKPEDFITGNNKPCN